MASISSLYWARHAPVGEGKLRDGPKRVCLGRCRVLAAGVFLRNFREISDVKINVEK